MSQSKLRSDNQNSVKTENGRPLGSRSTPIACRVCNMVFYDNVSLVLHFESHVEDGCRLRGRELAALRGDQRVSSRWSPYSYSSMARVYSRMNDRLRSRPLRVPSAAPPNGALRDPNLFCIPVFNVPQPFVSRYGAAPPPTCPLMYSQMGPQNFGYGSAMAPQLGEQNGGQMRFEDRRDQEIIVISDDEGDENKKTEEIDLTLKL